MTGQADDRGRGRAGPGKPARRPVALRRTWLFLPGAAEPVLAAAASSGADVLIQELEDFTPPDRRPDARRLAADLYGRWRAEGAVAAVRINPFETAGREDLAPVMAGLPDVVMMSKVAAPEQVVALDRAIEALERDQGVAPGATEIVPNIESAAGLVRTLEIARASPRVTACLVASEDLAADLGAERGPDGAEIAYARQRFLVECRAAGVEAIDCPYTYADRDGVVRDTRTARRWGYRAKSLVDPGHAATINALLTPDPAEVADARRLVAAFEAARAGGQDRVLLDGRLVELPTYLTARRLIARAEALAAWLCATPP
jgi:citrate lyase subunit beta/citryl-CoA lyase